MTAGIKKPVKYMSQNKLKNKKKSEAATIIFLLRTKIADN